ncbi:squalene/phytoene synthase family protein [Kitasatospora sp. NPDC093558]|uniref:squalene/phytoene synthase family protein n=1 Tax=Kitasatospora sp. NPDC093558 TaxID=3155201 RepID=UPI003448F182
MSVLTDAHALVRAYSTTWYEPVTSMPAKLNEATTAAYLCMRAIDEIEDHYDLAPPAKVELLETTSRLLQTRFTRADFSAAYARHTHELPEVTLRIGEWAALAPTEIAPRICETFAAMAERMADWVGTGFAIDSERDLDRYTYAVSGTLVLLLSDLWAWYDGTRCDRSHGIAYGRALQAANILIDRSTDTDRGVDFWPTGWQSADMLRYIRTEFSLAEQYVDAFSQGPARRFCEPALRRYQNALDARPRAAATGVRPER